MEGLPIRHRGQHGDVQAHRRQPLAQEEAQGRPTTLAYSTLNEQQVNAEIFETSLKDKNSCTNSVAINKNLSLYFKSYAKEKFKMQKHSIKNVNNKNDHI